VGWAFGPAPLIARMRDAKQLSDLHTDQLSQAVLLRFSESGRLAAHLAKMLEAGGERLRAVLTACERHLPAGSSFTRPRGGMNLWVNLPAPLDSADLLSRAQSQGASYLPSKFFAVSRALPGGLRLSFAGLDPEQIAAGVRILGSVFASELEQSRAAGAAEPAAAMV
jgi:2-aminoadipate transaminase